MKKFIAVATVLLFVLFGVFLTACDSDSIGDNIGNGNEDLGGGPPFPPTEDDDPEDGPPPPPIDPVDPPPIDPVDPPPIGPGDPPPFGPPPVSIIIDGHGEDWTGVNPIASDSKVDTTDEYGPVLPKGGDDIKALYKIVNGGYVYYMIEFWNPPAMELVGETTLEIFWDTNPGDVTMSYGDIPSEWTSNFSGYGFQVYELGLASLFGNAWFVDNAEIAVADVIEIKIPLAEFEEFIRIDGEMAEYLEETLVSLCEDLGEENWKCDSASVNNPMRTDL